MTKRKRRALIWVGSVFGIIVIAAVIFVATLDANKAKGYISAAVSKATGRCDFGCEQGQRIHISSGQQGHGTPANYRRRSSSRLRLDLQTSREPDTIRERELEQVPTDD